MERFQDEDRNKDGKVSWEEHFIENFGEGSVLHEHHEASSPSMVCLEFINDQSRQFDFANSRLR